MRRSITLAILAGVVSLASVVPGSADPTGEIGLCTISGTTSFPGTIGGEGAVLPEQEDFTMTGSVQCSGATRQLAGDLTAEGNGTVGCLLEISQGAFNVAFSTGDGLREVWSGQFASAGAAPAGAIIGNLNTITQEQFNEESQEWEQVGDPWVPNLTAMAGVVVFNSGPDQVDSCINDGATEAGFDATVVFAHGAA